MKKMRFATALAVACAAFAVNGAEIPSLKVDFETCVGPVKPVNGVGQPPIQGYDRCGMFRYLKEAGIPYSRLHDVGGAFGKNIFVDIPNLFRDFDADENDPANYDFTFTDILMKQLVANGVEPYFRLGVTIENRADVRAYRVFPPKDYAKWARICEHVIRHYTEGWANGFKMNITHWEIWNEADGNETPETNCMWRAPFSEYCKLYEVAAKHLKSKFPGLMIGGYASCGFYAVTKSRHHVQNTGRYTHLLRCFHDFVAYAREHSCPLDFFSFHCYDDPGPAVVQNKYVRDYLDANGFKSTQLSLNEWLPFTAIADTGSARQTAYIAAMLAVMQNGPIDDAEIYDARCGTGVYSPFFDPVTCKPRKPYWVYYAFNDLRILKRAVRASSPYPDVYVVAADDGFGTGAILLANASRSTLPLKVDLGGREVTSCRVIDETRTYEEAALPDVIPADSVWRITAKRRGAAAARPDLVAKAEAGELGYVRASWFGYDAEDSTRFLQAALSSKARRVIVDRLDEGPWVAKPLKIRSEKDIVFENGVLVEAKKGEFREPAAALFSISGAANVTMRGRATLRMHKADYTKPPYSRAEWRHGISALSVNNLVLEDLTVEETGGDGLYLGSVKSAPRPCRNVVVRNCTFARNARQGMSVISVDGLLVENTAMCDTLGMPPEAGIDFEPNSPTEVLKNCVLRNCSFDNNNGYGVGVCLAKFKASSAPVDIRLENCGMEGNKVSLGYSLGDSSATNSFYDGRVVLDNCVMSRGREGAVSIRRRKYATGETILRNCRIVDACTAAPTNAEVLVTVLGMEGAGPDGVRFENLSIRQPCRRDWLKTVGEQEYSGMPTVISGVVEVESPAGRVKEVFDAARHAAEFPYKAAKPLPKKAEFDADVFEEMVLMPDGVGLYTYGVRPPPGVKCPVVLVRSPYVENRPVDKEKFLRNQRDSFARGYAYIIQHCRGRGMSQGCWTPYEDERADGLALLAWVRKLPWYNGEIFLEGGSYCASVHWSYLGTNPPDVKGAVLFVQEVNRYNIVYRNGFFKSELHGGWFAKLYKQKNTAFKCEKPVHLWDFPLKDFSMRSWGETIPSFENRLAHPRAADPFWQSHKPGSGADYRRALLDSTMPVLMRTGLYDIYTEGICDMWRETPPSRLANCALLIDAYGHNGRVAEEMKGTLGEFPGGARADTGLSSLDWFDFCRTGRPAKAAPLGRVRYYALWENRWTEADALVDGRQKVEIALGSGSRSWTYDPKRPLPDFPGSGGICFGGMQWQPEPDFRDDVVSYLLPPVGKRLDVRGRMRVRLAVRSDCEDSSFYVRVSVKKPDGKWYLLRDDITSICADGRDYAPNAETFLDFRFADHAFRLDVGDVLRVDVASASRHFAPHGNVRGLQAAVSEPKVAHNSVRADASSLTLFALP